MDQLIKESLSDYNIISSVNLLEGIFAILISAFLNLILSKFYTYTHNHHSYSSSFAQSIVLVGITVTLIMIIIGSNIARAFALVGAMSIVRFRNPVKDSRDLAFIFTSIAIGMACGTQFYVYGFAFLILFCALLMFFKITKFGEVNIDNYVVKINLNKNKRDFFDNLLKKYCKNFKIISVENLDNEIDFEIIIFEFVLNKNISYHNFIDDIGNNIKPKSINLLLGENYLEE